MLGRHISEEPSGQLSGIIAKSLLDTEYWPIFIWLARTPHKTRGCGGVDRRYANGFLIWPAYASRLLGRDLTDLIIAWVSWCILQF